MWRVFVEYRSPHRTVCLLWRPYVIRRVSMPSMWHSYKSYQLPRPASCKTRRRRKSEHNVNPVIISHSETATNATNATTADWRKTCYSCHLEKEADNLFFSFIPASDECMAIGGMPATPCQPLHPSKYALIYLVYIGSARWRIKGSNRKHVIWLKSKYYLLISTPEHFWQNLDPLRKLLSNCMASNTHVRYHSQP